MIIDAVMIMCFMMINDSDDHHHTVISVATTAPVLYGSRTVSASPGTADRA